MRKKRFEEKIEYARERIGDLEDWLFQEDVQERKPFFASEKAFQELVESLSDIFAMLLSDLNFGIKDDYSNIEKLKEKNILSNEHANTASESNGLRNRIVHRYNSVDQKRFIESARELIPKITQVLEHIKTFIDGHEDE